MFSTLTLLEMVTVGLLIVSILQIMMMYHTSYMRSGYNTLVSGVKKISGLVS